MSDGHGVNSMSAIDYKRGARSGLVNSNVVVVIPNCADACCLLSVSIVNSSMANTSESSVPIEKGTSEVIVSAL